MTGIFYTHRQTVARVVRAAALLLIPILLGIGLASATVVVARTQANPPEPDKKHFRRYERADVNTETLQIGTQVPYSPFEFYSGTEIVGYDIDLMDAIANQMGVGATYVTVTWEGKFDKLITGEHDAVISALLILPEREEIVDFTLPYLDNIGIAVQQGDDGLRRAMNEALWQLSQDGTLDALRDKWLTDLDVPEPDWPTVTAGTDTTFIYTGTQRQTTTVQIPADAVTESIMMEYTPVGTETVPSGFSFVGDVFELEAYRDGVYVGDGYEFAAPITITLYYSDSDVAGLDETALLLEWWNEETGMWEDAACGSYDRHPDENWLAVPVCHLTRFALLFEEHAVFLPVTKQAP